MKQGLNLSRHIAITSSNDLALITEPLKNYFGITYFNYVKLLKNNGRVLLTDRADWIEYFYANALYETNAVQRMESLTQETFHLWCEFNQQPSFAIGREKFNIDNGLTIIQPGKEATELYYFGTTRENTQYSQLYAANLDIFYRFILFFKDKANGLLKKANSEVIHIPEYTLQVPQNAQDLFNAKKASFMAETKIDRVILSEEYPENYLTQREAECLYHLLHENTAKGIAKKLNISYRTVESYLDNIKTKLRISSKKELIQMCHDTKLAQQLIYSINYGD